jgi:hypothetical protein
MRGRAGIADSVLVARSDSIVYWEIVGRTATRMGVTKA